jgi:hypothetical protein
MPKSTNRRRYASPVSKLETQKQVRFAWAYIHQQSNADQHTPEEVRTIKIQGSAGGEALGVDPPRPKHAPAGD